jgi:hypothetical protein
MRKLFVINIKAVIVENEPMGDGYQVHIEGNRREWSRGDTIDEAIGSLIRRLAVEDDGTNARAQRPVDLT